jgi:tRNA threonylcarbamoyladenosine biosynthesis protein TsaE
MRIVIRTLKELHPAAGELLEAFPGRKLFAFYGLMGSGKTTIIKALCEHLGASDTAVSPTFTIVNEYKTEGETLICHFDFYRIKSIREVFDFGIEEYFSGTAYCFMEWPEIIDEILPEDTVKIRIVVGADEERILESF